MPVRILSCLSYSEYRLLQLARDVWARYRHGAKVPPARHSAVEEYLDALASVLHRKYCSSFAEKTANIQNLGQPLIEPFHSWLNGAVHAVVCDDLGGED